MQDFDFSEVSSTSSLSQERHQFYKPIWQILDILLQTMELCFHREEQKIKDEFVN